MEPEGLAVGPGGLTSLFSVSLDVLDRISTAKSYGGDYHLFAAKLAIEQRRFFRWGQAVGFTRTQQHELLQKSRDTKRYPRATSISYSLFRGLRGD